VKARGYGRGGGRGKDGGKSYIVPNKNIIAIAR